MINELIERYVYAVTKRLPYGMRKDIEKELRVLIGDMLEERCKGVRPEERDVRVVLAELGKPSELAAKYDPEGERSLIGPGYYRLYTQVLKLALPIVAMALAISAVVSMALGDGEGHWFIQIAEWLGNIITVTITLFAGITIAFAIMERKGVSINLDSDELDNLPAVPKENERIKKSDCIAGMVFSVVALVVFCFTPGIIGFYSFENRDVSVIPLFQNDVIRSLWPFWAAFFVLGVSREIFKLFEGVYTKRLAVYSAFVNIASAALCAGVFLRSNLLNTAFLDRIHELMGADAGFAYEIFAKFNIFLFVVISFALVLDTITVIVRAVKYSGSADK